MELTQSEHTNTPQIFKTFIINPRFPCPGPFRHINESTNRGPFCASSLVRSSRHDRVSPYPF
jgi:hypothetical protein